MKCSIRGCKEESVVVHKKSGMELCERHWLDYCNNTDEDMEYLMNGGRKNGKNNKF